MFFSIKYSIIQKQYAHKLYNSKKHQQYYHSYHLSLVIIPLRITTLLLSYFLVSWSFDFFLQLRLLDWSALPLPLSAESCNELLLRSTYFNQVYEDNRWWIPWYQTLRKRDATSWCMQALTLPNPTTSLQTYLLIAKYQWSSSNLQMTVMNSVCWNLALLILIYA